MSDITLATWNVEWAVPSRRSAIRERIASWNADILVVTEGDHGVLPAAGHCVDAGTDWGYRNTNPGWRKTILWSRWPLADVATEIPAGVRGGRLIDAAIDSPLGEIRMLAVCIPWRDAHVRTGIDPHGEPWREHVAFVSHLGSLIANHAADVPLVIMGDFNQRLPRSRQPHEVHDALVTALGPLQVITAGPDPLPGLERQEVDHIAVSHHFMPERVRGVDRHDGDRTLSDHDAIRAVVRWRSDP